jgi:NAD-dependent deacetylase
MKPLIPAEAIDYIRRNAKRGDVVCITGAGVSAPSGIPTFRGKGGLWEKYRPQIYATTMGLVSTFMTEPEKIVDFLNDLYSILVKAKPNPCHRALAEMEKEGIVSALITQNIDGLHQQAGSRSVIELHGNAYRVRCMNCLKAITWEKDRIREMIKLLNLNRQSRPQLLRVLSRYFPKCECGGRYRIDIVLFGEVLPQDALKEAYRALDTCSLLMLVGTSLAVYPAAALPAYAKQRGAKIVEINSEPSDSFCDLRIQGDAAVIMPQLAEAL